MRLRFFRFVACVFILSLSREALGAKLRVVLFVLDGVGEGAAAAGSLPSKSGRWARGSVSTPAGDSSAVASALATGCDGVAPGTVSLTPSGAAADKISQRFARSGYAFALLTTKCADDGTSSAFVASSADRYDLALVGESATTLSPSPSLITGGFSKSLWNATAAHGAAFVEFESEGGSSYSETCEYPKGESLTRRVSLVMDRLEEEGDRYFLTVVATGVDAAAHAGDASRVASELDAVREAIGAAERRLESGGGDWKMVVIGSHATGALSANGTLSHARHSSPGTLVPLFARGVTKARVSEARTMGDVSRLLSTKMTCTRERSHLYVYNGRRRRRLSSSDDSFDSFLDLWFSFTFSLLIIAFFCSCLFY